MLVKSPIITDGHGSVGETTWIRTISGMAVKDRHTPNNPQTARQEANRQNLLNMWSNWRGLTDAQRSGWWAYGANTLVRGYDHRPRYATGPQMFFHVNWMRRTAGGGIILNPPDEFGQVRLTLVTFADGTFPLTIRVFFDASDDWVTTNTTRLFFAISPPQSVMTESYHGHYGTVGQVIGSRRFPPVPGATNYPYPYPTAFANNRFFRTRVAWPDGRQSAPQFWGPLRL